PSEGRHGHRGGVRARGRYPERDGRPRRRRPDRGVSREAAGRRGDQPLGERGPDRRRARAAPLRSPDGLLRPGARRAADAAGGWRAAVRLPDDRGAVVGRLARGLPAPGRAGRRGEGGTMIMTRAPLRMPLGGGGTDLPSYYTRFGGFFIG